MRAEQRATIAAYDASAAAYRDATGSTPSALADEIQRFAARLDAGARVLEIGSGPGHDAQALEAAGLDVRRTDVSPGFVRLLRGAGHQADLVDPLTDDLADPRRPGTPYHAVWADACLLHVARADLAVVLARLAAATRVGGPCYASLKEGEDEAWSTHGHVAGPRLFVYWREAALREAFDGAGWEVERIDRRLGQRQTWWLEVWAIRRDGRRWSE